MSIEISNKGTESLEKMGNHYPGNIVLKNNAFNKASKHNFHCVWLGKSMLRLTCQAYAWPQVSANGHIAVVADSVELISGRANRICLATIVCAKLHNVSKYAAPQVHFNNYRDSFQFVCCGFLGIGKHSCAMERRR